MKLKKKPKVYVREANKDFASLTKKELAEIKALYKSGNLKFDSREIAETILKDKNLKNWFTSRYKTS